MRTLLFLLLLSTSTFAQTIITKNETVVSGLSEIRQFGEFLVANNTSQIKLVPAATVEIKTEAANVTVRFSDKERNNVPFVKVSDRQYLLTTPGKIWIDAFCIDFPKNIVVIEQAVVEIGPPAPPPLPPGPTPGPVPTDAFDNIGQRVAEWTKGLPVNDKLSKIYLDAAKSLRSDPRVTIDEVSLKISNSVKAIPEYTQYTNYIKGVSDDINKRWPLSKGVLADYWTAIAVGLNPPPRVE